MQWLTPMLGIYSAAVAVPLLLALYFLKLKRQEQVVSSTFLWQRAVRDLQVNAPFQRLRRNLLLLLQLLALLLILVSLAGPVLSLEAPRAQRTVILIDRSASMNARDGDEAGETSRLETAKEQARTLSRSLLETPGLSLTRSNHQIMVIAFARQAQVLCNFTSNRHQVETALEAIDPSDEEALLEEAVTVARAFAQAPGQETNNRSAEDPASLVLFSDGGIHDLDQVTVGADELRYQAVGRSGDNIAITALQARRDYEKPEELHVFALLANYSATSQTVDVQISLDGQVASVRPLTLPSATADPSATPGTAALDLVLRTPGTGLLEARHLAVDLLPADDVAWSVLQVARKPRVLLVTEGNPVLENALRVCSPAVLNIESAQDFSQRDPDLWTVDPPFDVVVLDNVTVPHTPRAAYMVLGTPPTDAGVTIGPEVRQLLAVDWRHRHPVLRHVNLARLFVAQAYQWELPHTATVLAEFTQGPAMAVIRRDQNVLLLVGFDVLQSNWPFTPGFVVFCYNALAFLGQQGRGELNQALAPGDPLVLEGLTPGLSGHMTGSAGLDETLRVDTTGHLRFANTSRTGVYRLALGDQPGRPYVVNLLNEGESDISPKTELQLASQQIAAADRGVQRSNRPLWPWLVAVALGLVCCEWMVYNARVRFI